MIATNSQSSISHGLENLKFALEKKLIRNPDLKNDSPAEFKREMEDIFKEAGWLEEFKFSSSGIIDDAIASSS